MSIQAAAQPRVTTWHTTTAPAHGYLRVTDPMSDTWDHARTRMLAPAPLASATCFLPALASRQGITQSILGPQGSLCSTHFPIFA